MWLKTLLSVVVEALVTMHKCHLIAASPWGAHHAFGALVSLSGFHVSPARHFATKIYFTLFLFHHCTKFTRLFRLHTGSSLILEFHFPWIFWLRDPCCWLQLPRRVTTWAASAHMPADSSGTAFWFHIQSEGQLESWLVFLCYYPMMPKGSLSPVGDLLSAMDVMIQGQGHKPLDQELRFPLYQWNLLLALGLVRTRSQLEMTNQWGFVQ